MRRSNGQAQEVQVTSEAIDDLKQSARASDRGRARICLHADHDDLVQEMVIALVQGEPVPAHRQVGKRKSYHVLEGTMRVTFFSETGTQERQYVLGDGAGARLMSFHAGTWHTCEAMTTVVVYTETIAGPYRADATEWRDWLPTT